MDGRLLALIAALFFGSSPIILALGLRDASANLAVLVGLIVGLPSLILLSLFLGGLHFNQLTLRTAGLFALGGMFGPFIGRTLFYNGIGRLGSSRAVTIKNSAPLATAVAAILILSEPVTLSRWLAIVLIVVGIAVVGKQSGNIPNQLRISGLILAILSAVSYGIRPVIFKLGFQEEPDPVTASVVGIAAALLGVSVYFWLSGQLRSLRLERRSLILFAIVGVVNNSAFLILNLALNLEDVTLIYPINSIAPLLTFGLAALILKNIEKLTIWDLIGTLSVVGGVVLLLA